MITVDVGDRDAAINVRRGVVLEQGAASVLYADVEATAHGVYEPRIGGQSVDGSVLNPGWTAYEWRLQVQRFDVTELVRSASGGTVDWSFVVGNGWFRGDLGFEEARANYGEDIGVIGRLTIRYCDGTSQVVVTDETWLGGRADTVANSIYLGQVIDARLRDSDAHALLPVRTIDFDRRTLIPQSAPPVVRHEELDPVWTWASTEGGLMVDFSQNLVGWVHLALRGPRGHTVEVRHAEVLDREGELDVRPLRRALSQDRYVLSGGDDVFEPTLTFHGFRYAEVTGINEEVTVTALHAVVVHSAMERTGWFECSDPRVNQLVSNSVWGQKGNFLSVPTDCPQRDERLGWTGDIAVYAPTACFQFDVADFLHGWLLDVAAETRHRIPSFVPYVVPDILKYAHFNDGFVNPFNGPYAIWGDAAVWVPEALYEAYGDRDRLAEQYPGMVLHLESIEPRLEADGTWEGDRQLGDWLDPDAPIEDPWAAKADPGVVATASFHRSVVFAAEAARIIGQDEDARRWAVLAARIRTGFRTRYVDADGTVRSDASTAYALAICFGLLDAHQEQHAGDRLAELTAEADFRVSTGFAGTPYLTWALSRTGHVAEAYRLLLQDQNPSWLDTVAHGATTIWERWDSILPDGSNNPGTSFNHYALGAVTDWLYKVVAGINPASPGYQTVRLTPTPGPGLDWARGSLQTPRGRVECGWTRAGTGIQIEVSLPAGVAGQLHLPNGTVRQLAAGTTRIDPP